MLHSRRYGLVAIVSLALVIINLPTSFGTPLDLFPGKSSTQDGWHRKFAPGKLGAVASESSICSGHGTEMLKMGGNAADAVSTSETRRHDTEKLRRMVVGRDGILHRGHR